MKKSNLLNFLVNVVFVCSALTAAAKTAFAQITLDLDVLTEEPLSKQTADEKVIYDADIKVGEKGKKLSDAPGFEFEGIRFNQESVRIGCSETSSGEEETNFEIGYFTYRTDITDFFQKIYEKNKSNGNIVEFLQEFIQDFL